MTNSQFSTIPESMSAIVYRGVDDLRLERVPVPQIQSGELLVKVAACGVCPTDIKKIHYGTVPPPRIFGHETAGTIVKLGARVRGFRVGDRVALHHHIPCLKCHYCRHQAFAQCPGYKRTGITAGFEPAGGGYAEYVRVMPFVLPGVVKIPARNTFIEGAMLEPVNTVLKAVKRLRLLRGDVVLVAGQGPIGLMFTKILSLRGIRVVATDLLEARLKLALEWGADEAIQAGAASQGGTSHKTDHREPLSLTLSPPSGAREQETSSHRQAREQKEQTPLWHSSKGFDAAVIAVPSDEAVAQALDRVRGSAQVLLFAHTKKGNASPIELSSVCRDEKDLIGSYSSDFTLQKEVARLVFSRRLDVRKLVTHTFPLEKTAQAVALAAAPRPESLKIVVVQ